MNTMRRNAHPRPDRIRKNWMMLNGPWSFQFDRSNEGKKQRWYQKPDFPLRIEVPYVYQAALSGVEDKSHCDVIWYAREVEVPASMEGQRVLLHFGAVDYLAEVWLDGQFLGSHEGGYTPFTFDITDLVQPGARHTIVARCEDRLDQDQPRGKQSWRPEPFACWYTPVSGIWQSVWLEAVGEVYPTEFRLTPCIEKGSVHAEIDLNECPAGTALLLTASFDGRVVARQEVTALQRHVRAELCLAYNESLEGVYLWSPEWPNLYDLTIETLVNGVALDRVDTYFGMRRIAVEGDKILLNNNALYQRLVLDQGYWPDGLLTAPTDEALRRDVELTKAMGFNGARKHQKFEDPQYLYWADKLGLLVWGELPSAYWLRESEKRNLLRDLGEAIRRDYNHPSLITWTPLNESWGVPFVRYQPEAQKLADALCALVHTLDGTRLVSGNDGWEQADTDIATVHDYTAWPEQLAPDYGSAEGLLSAAPAGRVVSAQGYDHRGKPMLMTEYGGIAMARDAGGGNWGYNDAAQDEESFLKRYEAITRAFGSMPVFCGYCYTQLTDVFQEVNGLLDMNRQPKASLEEIRRVNLRR